MGVVDVYSDEFLQITIENSIVYAETFKKGFPVEKLSAIIARHPEIGLTSINTLRNSIMTAPVPPKIIGELKERICLSVSPEGLTASISFNLTVEELAPESRENLKREILMLLSDRGIIYGIDNNLFREELKSGQYYFVAKGTPAVDGIDAQIKMYELMEAKPEVGADGKVDFYDMRLINRVKPGDWLGERIEPTDGTPGKTVKGEIIKAVKGKTTPLNYDKNSVKEISSDNKTILYSRLSGAVNYTDGRISVSNHLEIDGNVGIATGNIKFDGYVTIKGTILDGFSVEATKDIEINGQYGLGNIKNLVSTNGSIFIRGGISTKEGAEIRAAKSVFIKFADNAQIICGEAAHIGFYSLHSNIIAKDVIFDSSNGQIIGGSIKSEIHVSVPFAGSDMERKTSIEVTGFDRKGFIDRLDTVFHELSIKKVEQQKLKQQSSANREAGTSSTRISDRLYLLRDEIKALEEERKLIAGYLKTKGDGEIEISKRLYPNCRIIMGGMITETTEFTSSVTFYLKDREIKTI